MVVLEPGTRRPTAAFLVAFMLLMQVSLCAAQETAVPAGDLVRKTIANELKEEPAKFLFRSRKETGRGSQTHLYVQTKDATAGVLIAVNDQPLTAEQKQAEEARLEFLASHPVELRRKQKQERDDADRINRIMRAMPDAFVYEYAGTEEGKPGIGSPGDQLVRLNFRPNPRYSPPTRVEQVLTGMEGVMLIDSRKYRIARIDGTLYRDVGFGWGFFGHLDRGGRFQVEQGTVNDGGWEMTRMGLNFTGKILLFKNLLIHTNESFSDFQAVPSNLSFQQGAALLKKELAQPVTRESRNGGGSPNDKH